MSSKGFTKMKIVGIALGIIGGVVAAVGDIGDLKDAVDELKDEDSGEENHIQE